MEVILDNMVTPTPLPEEAKRYTHMIYVLLR